MKIMGLEDLFQIGLNFATSIDFSQSKTKDTVSVFESTVRYIGGLLSAYELNGRKPQLLVDKAKQLANGLSLGFQGSVVLPFGYVDFSTGRPVVATVSLA
jgi:mannosyl-oligosaccharide alpha-1,2-mannosidase